MKITTNKTITGNSSYSTCISTAFFQRISVCGLLISLAYTWCSFGSPEFSKQRIASCVREVFGAQADELVLHSTSGRLELITDFLQRVEVKTFAGIGGKGISRLSEVPLNNKYNPSLTRDLSIDAATFNPLKYRLPMTSKRTELFAVDNTDTVIIIHAQK